VRGEFEVSLDGLTQFVNWFVQPLFIRQLFVSQLKEKVDIEKGEKRKSVLTEI